MGGGWGVWKRLEAFSNAQLNAYETYTLNALPVQMLGQDPKNGHFVREVLTFWVPFLVDFLTHFGVDFKSIFNARAGSRHHHRSSSLIEKTRDFCKGVQQNSRVLSFKKAVEKRFVETKSHRFFANA